ncbi:MAG: carbon monoxide dehydrogenase beta subunit family protein [Aquificota bacterium]|nr:carbon monoxide dehydrogenase beta subunit family protein [Aquificota bacterium]
MELDLYVEDSEKILSLKETVARNGKKKKERPVPSPHLKDFIPEYYRIPKVAPGPEEDRTRLPIVREKSTDIGFIGGEKVSWEEALNEAVKLVSEAERPTLIVGPLVLWDWNEEVRRKAEAVRRLKDLIPNLNIHVLPDYKPKNRKFDPSREIDPPNPHLSILHGRHDLTLMIGVHCYRTDFVIRMLRKHTDTKIVTLCGLYGHPDADVSLSGTDPARLSTFLDRVAGSVRHV